MTTINNDRPKSEVKDQAKNLKKLPVGLKVFRAWFNFWLLLLGREGDVTGKLCLVTVSHKLNTNKPLRHIHLH